MRVQSRTLRTNVTPSRALLVLAAHARARGLPPPAMLSGDWFGSRAVIAPSLEVSPGPVSWPAPVDAPHGVVGGGWFGYLSYDSADPSVEARRPARDGVGLDGPRAALVGVGHLPPGVPGRRRPVGVHNGVSAGFFAGRSFLDGRSSTTSAAVGTPGRGEGVRARDRGRGAVPGEHLHPLHGLVRGLMRPRCSPPASPG